MDDTIIQVHAGTTRGRGESLEAERFKVLKMLEEPHREA